MQLARRLLWLALIVAILVFGWQLAARNSTVVDLDYMLGRLSGVALWLVVLVAFAAGAGAATLIASYRMLKLGLLTRRYRKTVTGLEAEVHQLRNLPLASDDLGQERADALGLRSGDPPGRGV